MCAATKTPGQRRDLRSRDSRALSSLETGMEKLPRDSSVRFDDRTTTHVDLGTGVALNRFDSRPPAFAKPPSPGIHGEAHRTQSTESVAGLVGW
jgi:hypothetical protein